MLAVLSSSGARADEPGARADESAPRVDITILGGGDPALEASIADLLASVGMTTRITRVGGDWRRDAPETKAGDALALVQLDPRREGALEVRIVDPRRRRVLVRDLPVPNGIDEIVREETSHIVVFSVEAIARGEVVGEAEPPPARAPPAAVRARPVTAVQRRAVSLDLETVGTVRTYASVAPAVLGTGATLALSSARSRVQLGGALSFEQRSPIVVTTQPLTARFVQRSVRISFRGDIPIASRVAFHASAGAALDLVNVTTTPLRSTSEPRRAAFVDAVPVLDVTGGLRVELAPRLAVSAEGGIELPLSTSDYVVEDGRGRDLVLLAPHSVRLVGRLTVGVRF
jgi:hypothetical protein